MNTYFLRYKIKGQLIQDVIKAPDPETAIEVMSIYTGVSEDRIIIYAWRDAKGNLTRLQD